VNEQLRHTILAFLISLMLGVSAPNVYAESAPLPLYKQPARNLKMEESQDYRDPQISPKQGWRSLPRESRNKSSSSAPWWAQALLWIPNRVLDLIDVFRIDVGAGPAVGGIVRITRHGQAGYRRMLPFSLRVGDFGRSSPIIIETDDELGVGDSFRPSGDRTLCRGEIGLGLDLGLGAYAGICPAELVDFFAGLIFIDPESDDI